MKEPGAQVGAVAPWTAGCLHQQKLNIFRPSCIYVCSYSLLVASLSQGCSLTTCLLDQVTLILCLSLCKTGQVTTAAPEGCAGSWGFLIPGTTPFFCLGSWEPFIGRRICPFGTGWLLLCAEGGLPCDVLFVWLSPSHAPGSWFLPSRLVFVAGMLLLHQLCDGTLQPS